MEDLNRQFLHLLDEIAERRIKLYAKRSGLSTGPAHRRSIDTLIVVINAYLMVGNRCRIYSERATPGGPQDSLAHFLNTLPPAGWTTGQMPPPITRQTYSPSTPNTSNLRRGQWMAPWAEPSVISRGR